MARDYKKDYERRKIRDMQVNVRLSRSLGDKLRAKLAKEGKKLTDFIREAVEEYLKK